MEKSSDNKRIAKNTFLLYIRMLFVLVISLLTSRYVLAALGEVDFGLYNVVGGVVSTFTFISMALGNATSRYITFYLGKGDKDELNIVFSTAFIVQLIMAVAILVLAETVGLWFLNTQMNIPDSRMVAANWVYQFSILTTITSIMCIPYNSEIIAHEKMGIFAYISIFDVVMKLLIVFLFTDKLRVRIQIFQPVHQILLYPDIHIRYKIRMAFLFRNGQGMRRQYDFPGISYNLFDLLQHRLFLPAGSTDPLF